MTFDLIIATLALAIAVGTLIANIATWRRIRRLEREEIAQARSWNR